MQQVQALSQSVNKLLVLCSIFSQINLCLAVAWVAVVLTLVKEVRIWLIVMLVDDWHTQLVCQFPASLKVRIARMRTRTCRTYYDNIRISLCHAFIYIFKALAELRRDFLLVTDTQILQVERLWMTSVSTHLCPFVCCRVAISPLYQVYSLTHPLVHL